MINSQKLLTQTKSVARQQCRRPGMFHVEHYGDLSADYALY